MSKGLSVVPGGELDDAEKALICITGNIFVLVIASILWWFQHGASWRTFALAATAEIITILIYLVIAVLPEVPDALKIAYQRIRGRSGYTAAKAARQRSSLWLGVAFNGLTWGIMIHVTGGPATSPYSSIAVVMLVTGQLALVTDNRSGLWSSYSKTLALGAVLFTLLTWFHSSFRPGIVPAVNVSEPPALESLAVLLFSLVASTVLNQLRDNAEGLPVSASPPPAPDGLGDPN